MDELLLIFRSNSPKHLSPVERVKTLFPATEACELHALLYSRLGERAAWKALRKTALVPIQSYHQDEIPDQVRSFLLSYDPELPIILKRQGKNFTILAGAEDIQAMKGDFTRLVDLLKQANVLS